MVSHSDVTCLLYNEIVTYLLVTDEDHFVVWMQIQAFCRVNTFINTLRPKQNDRHLADDTFKHIFLNENVRISIKISLKFVPEGPINNIPSLV